MKVGLVHLNLATESGDPRMFYCVAQALKRKGCFVTVYTAKFDQKYFPELHRGLDIRVVSMERGASSSENISGIFEKIKAWLDNRRFQKEAVQKLKGMLDNDFQILVLQNDLSYTLGIYYHLINKRARTVWILNNAPFYHAHKENILVNLGSIAKAFMEKLQVKKFVHGIDFVVVHDAERKKTIEPFGVPVAILNIPVDYAAFHAPVKKRKEGDKKVNLLGVGALSPARRFEDIIAAGGILEEEGYDVKVTLVCKDYWKNEAFRVSLIGLTRELGMGKRVRFLFEGVSEEELRQLQRESDIFIFPNVINIWGMAALEAMAAGLPLIVSKATSVAEALKDGETALFSEPGEPKDIAAKIRQLIDHPDVYKKIATTGQKFVKENLDWDKYAEIFLRMASTRSQ